MDNEKIIHDIAREAFGQDVRLVRAEDVVKGRNDGQVVVVFAHRWGTELKIPNRDGDGFYFIDWVLAKLGSDGSLEEFLPIEVQSMDTTGNYHAERKAILAGRQYDGRTTANLNWENVSKRILPQIILKGNVVQYEPLCKKGLFFVAPTPVYKKIHKRLGEDLQACPKHPGTITFRWYGLSPDANAGEVRPLFLEGELTTTLSAIAHAFVNPRNLPEPRCYEKAVKQKLGLQLDG